MEVVNAFLGALLVAAGSYITICFYHKKNPLEVRQKGSMIYSPFMIGVVGLAFLAVFALGMTKRAVWGLSDMLLHYSLIWGMSVLAVTDHWHRRIPNRFLIALLMIWALIAGTSIILFTESGMALLFRGLAGGLAGGLTFLLCYIFSRKQLGAGDVKLAFVMGLYLTGRRIMGAIFYGIAICCVYSIIQLIRRKIGWKDGVALVPFLYLGALIALCIL